MIAYSLFINFYFSVLGYIYSRDRREWWDLSQDEKEELLRKHLPEDECTEELEGDFPEGWFDLEDWEKKAILDKNLDDYYKNEQSRVGRDVQYYVEEKNRSTQYSRCTIV
tara:strand:- start:1934 stop:2263 length:330 start_codon:yes stop_codon:yes gene_type:complete